MPRHRRRSGNFDTSSSEKGLIDMMRARGQIHRNEFGYRALFYEVLVSQKLRFAILLALTLFISPALAQPGAMPAPPQANATDALTPEQAKRALETLQDDKKRSEIINTLRAIATASPQPAPAGAGAVPDTAHRRQPRRAAVADGVRTGHRSLAARSPTSRAR